MRSLYPIPGISKPPAKYSEKYIESEKDLNKWQTDVSGMSCRYRAQYYRAAIATAKARRQQEERLHREYKEMMESWKEKWEQNREEHMDSITIARFGREREREEILTFNK